MIFLLVNRVINLQHIRIMGHQCLVFSFADFVDFFNAISYNVKYLYAIN